MDKLLTSAIGGVNVISGLATIANFAMEEDRAKNINEIKTKIEFLNKSISKLSEEIHTYHNNIEKKIDNRFDRLHEETLFLEVYENHGLLKSIIKRAKGKENLSNRDRETIDEIIKRIERLSIKADAISKNFKSSAFIISSLYMLSIDNIYLYTNTIKNHYYDKEYFNNTTSYLNAAIESTIKKLKPTITRADRKRIDELEKFFDTELIYYVRKPYGYYVEFCRDEDLKKIGNTAKWVRHYTTLKVTRNKTINGINGFHEIRVEDKVNTKSSYVYKNVNSEKKFKKLNDKYYREVSEAKHLKKGCYTGEHWAYGPYTFDETDLNISHYRDRTYRNNYLTIKIFERTLNSLRRMNYKFIKRTNN